MKIVFNTIIIHFINIIPNVNYASRGIHDVLNTWQVTFLIAVPMRTVHNSNLPEATTPVRMSF
jgi:hypothetical protein